eukprot:4145058-Prymnesium_polylepis.1
MKRCEARSARQRPGRIVPRAMRLVENRHRRPLRGHLWTAHPRKLAQRPRVPHRAAAHHYGVAAGESLQLLRIGPGAHISVADDRQRRAHKRLDLADSLPPRWLTAPLLTVPGVHRQIVESSNCGLRHRKVHLVVLLSLIHAEPDLGADSANVERRGAAPLVERLEQESHLGSPPEHGWSRAALRQRPGRAAKVEINRLDVAPVWLSSVGRASLERLERRFENVDSVGVACSRSIDDDLHA